MVYKTALEIESVNKKPYLLEWSITEEEKDEITDARVILFRDTNTLSIEVDQEIEIWRGETVGNEEKVFHGFISKVKPEGAMIILECQDKLGYLIRAEVTKSYDWNIDPSAGKISDIFLDLVNNYSDGQLLADSSSVQDSWSAQASRPFKQFRCNHADTYERCKLISDHIGWRFYYRADTDKVYFEPKGATATGVIFKATGDGSGNITGVPKWNYDDSNAVNDVTIIGAKKVVETTELASGTGSQDTFLLNYLPVSIKVFVGGVLQEGGIERSSGAFDYEVDRNPERPAIVFESGSIPGSGTDNIEIRYGYSVPIPIRNYDQASIDRYKRYKKSIIIKDLKTADDAEEKAKNIIGKFKDPFIFGKIKVTGTDDVRVNQTVQVQDDLNNEDRILLIRKKKITYPQREIEYEVGDKAWRLNKWTEDVEIRLRKFEEEELENQDILTHVVTLTHRTPFRRQRLRVMRYAINDSMVWAHPTPANGTWGTAVWGDRRSAPVIEYDKIY